MGRKKLDYVKLPNTFKLTKEAQEIIDPLPKMDKAKFVNSAIVEKHTYEKVLNINKKFYDKEH